MSFILTRLLPYAWPIAAAAGLALLGAVGVQTVKLAGERADHADTRTAFAEHRRLAERASRIQSENFAAKSSAWRAEQQENADAYRVTTDELLGLLAAERTGRQRLSDRLTALAAAAGQAPRDPGAQPAGPTAGQAADLLAYVSRRLDEAASGIGEFAERSHGSGTLCERDYDALKREAVSP